MIAPNPRKQTQVAGSFGDPLRRTVGSTWTEAELRGLKRRARFRSVAAYIRSLIGPEKLKELAEFGRGEMPEN